MQQEKQILILGHGRSGTTLLLRMLNQVPGAFICGENNKCLDVLKKFYDLMEHGIINSRINEFSSWAWKQPGDENHLLEATRRYIRDIYNPGGKYLYWGYKEIRYGFWNLDTLTAEINFTRLLMPNLSIVFMKRDVMKTANSAWWRFEQGAPAEIAKCQANIEKYLEQTNDDHHAMLINYEDLYRGSQAIQDMFAFLGIEFDEKYEEPLDVVLRW